MTALVFGPMVTVLVIGDALSRGLVSVNSLAWIAVTLGLGFYYQRGRRDLVILAMLVAGVICVSLRIVGEWLLRLEPGVWAALPLAALLMAEAVWAARWLRGLAAGPQMCIRDSMRAGRGVRGDGAAGPGGRRVRPRHRANPAGAFYVQTVAAISSTSSSTGWARPSRCV